MNLYSLYIDHGRFNVISMHYLVNYTNDMENFKFVDDGMKILLL